MAWRPSDDETIQRPSRNALWEAIETYFDNRIGTASLPRNSWVDLCGSYIIERRYDAFHNVEAMRSRLPTELLKARLGPTEIELSDFLINYSTERVLSIEGPRGSGKTSLLRYVESAIRQSGYSRWPVMLIVDCLSESEENVLTDAQVATLIAEEVLRSAAWVPDGLKEPLTAAAAAIRKSPKTSVVRMQFVQLKETLGVEYDRLVLVFDNLDQHLPPTISRCMEVTKQLHVSTRLASLITLRPGCLQSVQSRGGARAYFRFRMNVSAPRTRSWLEYVGSRVAVAAEVEYRQTGKYRMLGQRPLDPVTLSKIFQRLGRVLEVQHRGQDSAVGILDSVASDDIRHLVLLVRHLLSHRDLPVDWLLSDELAPPDYFPIAGILEGDEFLYRGKSFVPNLLCRDAHDGTHDFLIGHRILTFLNAGIHAVDWKHLLWQLRLLGHSDRTIVEAVKALHDALLIRSTSAERVSSSGRMPEAFFITEAGEYYLHRLLGYVDYLVTVMPNVPLVHESLKTNVGRRRSFAYVDRLLSLREFVGKVREQETAQIDRLARHVEAEDVAALADALENGGLLCNSLLDGLVSARSRGEHSRSEAVQRESLELDGVVDDLRDWIAAQQERLRGIAERARDKRVPSFPDVVLSDLDTEVSVRRTLAKSSQYLQTSVEVRTLPETRYALVALVGSTDSSTFSAAALAVPKTPARTLLYADLLNEAGSGVDKITDLKAQAIIGGLDGLGRIGLLTTSDNGGDVLNLRLQLLKSDKAGIEKRAIGRPVSFESIKADIESLKEAVVCSAGSVDDFEVVFREQGTHLSRLLLDEEGENMLSAYRHLVDTLIIFVSKKAMAIPWEWIRPAPTKSDPNPPSLGEAHRVVRWPGETMENVVEGMAQLSVSTDVGPIAPVKTIGLGDDKDKPWRLPSTMRVPELFSAAEHCSTLHVVGHVPEESTTLEVLDGGPHLSEKTLRAYRLSAPQVILSGCEVASTKQATNLAIELSVSAGCTVWAPLVRVKRSDVDSFDVALASAQGTSLSQHFRDRRMAGDVLAHFYTRYGISKGEP